MVRSNQKSPGWPDASSLSLERQCSMATRYYVARGEQEYGPFTSADLRAMAARGKIQPSDAIWPEGGEERVPASRVKNLFPESTQLEAASAEPAPELAADDELSTDDTTHMAADDSADTGTLPAVDDPSIEKPIKKPTALVKEREKRVVSIKGGVICSQDGKHVQFRGKCATCGYEAQGRSTLAIRQGPMKVNFFCRKCRKGRQVEMMGIN
jgi:hypothetical protein